MKIHQRSCARAIGRAVCSFGLIGGGILAVSSPARANLLIVPTFDSSITSDPNAATIEAGINAAIARVEAHILNPVTVNITFQIGSIGGVLGTSIAEPAYVDYATYHSALQTAQILSANDNTALATLPAGINNPTTGSNDMQLTAPLARALGIPLLPTSSDGTIMLDTSLMNLSRTGPQNPAFYDLQAIAGHEIDEILDMGGTGSQLSSAPVGPAATIGPEDLFRFSAAGVRSFTPVPATAYFSIDGGVTHIANFYNLGGPADYGDWGAGGPPRIQDALATPGVQVDIGPAELTGLDVIGWNLAPVPEPASLSVMALGMLGVMQRRGRRPHR